ncbi:MAG: AzlD domain-containing protein [Erysipelotrichaceae bacterium]|nr:AzlD domain-containing protein [Erysipelotrichaceae bacterium]MCI9524915.1 AzlD domain-containing protein [Erysipelotrichaceae bacterium]
MNTIFYTIVMAGVTYLIRAIPLLFVRKEIKNRYVKSFLHYLPYAVLGAMTFPAIFTSGGDFIPSLVGTCFASMLALKGKDLLTVALAACVAVYLAQLLLTLLSL